VAAWTKTGPNDGETVVWRIGVNVNHLYEGKMDGVNENGFKRRINRRLGHVYYLCRMAEKWAALTKTGPNDGLAVVWPIHR